MSEDKNNMYWSNGEITITNPTLEFKITANESKALEPETIIYNNGRTVVIWNDGTKTVSTTSSSEAFDPEVGFAICLMKKMYGKKVYGRKLYRCMIRKAKAQDKNSKEDLENWKQESSRKEKETNKSKKSKKTDIPF